MMSRMQIKLFSAIIKECKRGRHLVHFSAFVRHRLEQYDRKARKEIVSRKSKGCAPLFYACETGNVNMVEYLVSTCGANVDQTGRWDPHEGRALPDFGTTPLHRACCKAKNYRIDIVKYLVKHGADINRADAFGRTCLMDAVHDVELCEFVLKSGADVNARDVGNRTALHYAIETIALIEERMLDAVKLLLDHGADVTRTSNDNDDALQTACLKGYPPVFDYLVEHGSYSPWRLADANELMGASRFLNRETKLKYWRKATEIRNANAVDGKPLAKLPSMPKRDCYGNVSEFTTLDELNAIALNFDALTLQSFLIYERILGEHHRATFDPLHYIVGPLYARTLRYQDCLDFWGRALEISVVNVSILWSDVADVAKGLVRASYNLHERIPLEVADPNRVSKEQSRFASVVAIFKLLTNRLVTAKPPSETRPRARMKQQDGYEDILKCIIHLIDLLVKMARTGAAEDEVRALVRHLVNQNPMSPWKRDTPLHLSVTRRGNTITSKYFPFDFEAVDFDAHIFPVLDVTKLLLECEADVDARNVDGKTPLRIIASSNWEFSNQIVKLLLDHGAHLDTPDKWGLTPGHQICGNYYTTTTVDLVNYTTLRCLAAQAIVKYEIQCNGLPASVNQFLDLHRP